MKYIRETSDIHLDFDASKWHPRYKAFPGEVQPTCEMDMLWYPEPMEGDDETTMIIAGDLWTHRRFLKRKHPVTKRSWLAHLCDQFKYVVFVLGNHDMWGCNTYYEHDRINEAIDEQGLTGKAFLLERDSIILDGVKFVGGTLWTDYDRGNPLVMFSARSIMNDYKYMRSGPAFHKVMPQELLDTHRKTRDFIFEHAVRDTPDQKVVVVTHMAPSFASIPMHFRGGKNAHLNFCYYSDLEMQIFIQDHIDLWFHGHTHAVHDYKINETRVICNPRGYAGYDNTMWDPRLRIEL